jgi:hypothetical protein
MSRLKPQAAYFVADRGRRCAMVFFNMREGLNAVGARK